MHRSYAALPFLAAWHAKPRLTPALGHKICSSIALSGTSAPRRTLRSRNHPIGQRSPAKWQTPSDGGPRREDDRNLPPDPMNAAVLACFGTISTTPWNGGHVADSKVDDCKHRPIRTGSARCCPSDSLIWIEGISEMTVNRAGLTVEVVFWPYASRRWEASTDVIWRI